MKSEFIMNKLSKALAVLIVEDTESDAQLIIRLLKKAGYELMYEQVETAEEMRAALKKQNWDIVISDYKMPQFNGRAALQLLQGTGRDIPFIVVSGTIGEKTAVSMMKAGAHDYLIKGDFARLIPAVERELEQSEIRRRRRLAEEGLAASEAELRALFASMQDVVLVIDCEGVYRKVAPTNLSLLAIPPAELLGKNLREVFPIEQAGIFIATIQQVLATKQTTRIEYQILVGSQPLWFEASISPMDRDNTLWVAHDITARKHAEDALRESEERYRSLFDHMLDGMYRSTHQGKFVNVNSAMVKMFGYSTKEEMLEIDIKTDLYFSPEERVSLVLDSGQGELDAYRLRRKDGSEIWIEDHGTYVYDEQGKVIYHEGIMRDVTERVQAGEALAASEAKLRALVEQVPTTVYTESAETRETLYISPQVEKLTGYTPAEWIADRYLWNRITYPEDLAALLAEDERTSVTLEPFHIEYRILTRDGRVVWIRDEAVMIQNQDETPLFWQGVMYDITERKQSEEQLRKLSRAVDQNPVSIVITDLHGSIEYVNPKFSQVTGYGFSEALGQNPRILKSGNTTREEYKKMWNTILSGNVWQGELLNKTKSGETFWEFATIAPVFSEDGKITNFLALKENITERKRAEEDIHRRVTELGMLYQSGLALSHLLNPKEVGQKILELLQEKLNWHHTRIRLYHPQDDSLELLDFNRPGLQSEQERNEVVNRFQFLIAHSSQGMSGWVVQHGQSVRSGDVSHDPRYVEAYPGIQSGLYVLMKLGERIVGVISIEDTRPDAFSEADERLIATLANQAASAFENARLFEETRQRVMELETLNRISLVLRAVLKQNEMLSIVLDEALAILNTPHGSIELYNKTTDTLDQTILRGWIAKLTAPHHISQGIAGKVFTSGEIYISREFASDPETRPAARSQIPSGWGGICLPIRTTQQTLGVLVVSVPSGRELNRNEIRLLATLSEMTGAALQRMQLHEQTIRRLEQLHALRAVDQAIASNLDMRLTLNILINQTVSQLSVDAADVLLLHPGSNLLELVAGHGFDTPLPESVSLSDSFAGRAIMEHQTITALDSEIVSQYPQILKLWKKEGFSCYWGVPLIVKGEVKGVLEVYCRQSFTPDAEWLEFLETLAGQAAITIDTAQLFENLQRANLDLSLAYEATIEGWSRAMDLRDHETEGHTLRVTDLTVNLARVMHVSESQLTAIRHGALLHDIGKMGIPDAILLKEGKLTDEEWTVMRTHPILARDMLLPVAYLNDALDIPYCHHEKWDGTGYPQGLKGDRIPLVARIFAIVDVWDALTNNRTYRKKWTKQTARQYIKEQSGKHFDPQIVDIFLKNIGKG